MGERRRERERNFSSGARRQGEKEKGWRRQDFKILQILNRRVETGRECTSGGRGGVEGVQRCNKQVYVNSSKKNEKKAVEMTDCYRLPLPLYWHHYDRVLGAHVQQMKI